MLTSKQRSFLRGKANAIDSIFQVGKGGISENLIKQLDDALEARELIKIHILPSAQTEKKELCRDLAKELSAEEVQLIGNRLVLYRKSVDNPRIELPY
ncbi:MAG: ribosome assembly RNA-binding protein YhbY [Clostridiales bacterium]|nr:ribosome assembly RNA-binding protein YhbY [Clostridiales bacterium]